ncbi:hypothetical protein JW813_05260 [Clostridium botulinum]|uniref:hypothetical protein n=1 Tax=Clostridium botulinum TaxID=1491 RepID=UPI00224618A3|nr:hypothetical protein [Clostridium botulinum]UZP04417.1 hypothetical protein JW813_05260 [Clostridium botulinum]UZP07829.1 hypothetical protein JYA71_05535 [Clostridium botulinum]UZP11156.1 hypothetical protein JYA74_05255 [Clostridium botulinum]
MNDLLCMMLENISNVLLVIGLISILIFLYMSFGLAPTILGFGIMSVIASIIMELNKMKAKKINDTRRY